jgi:micrococcal nuclease
MTVAVVATGCTAPAENLVLPPADPAVLIVPLPVGIDAVVDRVVDGDTLVVSGRRVRLIGIDTPETVKPDSDVECFGPQASAATKALVPAGTAVRLVTDVERQDRYGRDLAYVYRSRDGLFVAGYLAREGFGRALSIKPNVAQRARIAALADDARAAGRGLWGECG